MGSWGVEHSPPFGGGVQGMGGRHGVLKILTFGGKKLKPPALVVS